MLVKSKKGEVETMRYGAAMDAVVAGTHTLVNVKDEVSDGREVKAEDLKPETAKAKTETAEGAHAGDLDAMTKDELLAEAARRDVPVKPSDTKAEITAALKPAA